MKALISAFALLSFVAASTIPYVAANAQTTTHSTTPKKKTAKKPVKKASVKKKTSTKKSSKKPMNQPA